MQKCNFCTDRLHEKKIPACVRVCPTGALNFIDYIEQKLYPPGFPDINIKPSIEFVHLRKMTPPRMADEAETTFIKRIMNEFVESKDQKKRNKNKDALNIIRNEYPLITFTFLAILLFSSFSSGLLNSLVVAPIFFISIFFISLGIGIFHLGNIKKSYRAIFNLKKFMA